LYARVPTLRCALRKGLPVCAVPYTRRRPPLYAAWVTRIVSVDPIFAAADMRRAAEHYK